MREYTVYDVFRRNAQVHGPRPSLVCNGRSLSHEEVFLRINRLAAGFREMGIGKGDRIGILAQNCHRFFEIFGAAAAVGAIVVPINWRLSREEIEHILADCSPKALCVDAVYAGLAEKMAEAGFPGKVIGFFPESPNSLDNLMKKDGIVSPELLTADDPFCMIYTAAVAGKSRGAVLSHGNIIASDLQTIATMGLNAQDAYLNILPIFHITGINLSLSVMHAGGKNVLMERFDARKALENMEQEKITIIGSFPPILSNLNSEIEKGGFHLSSLRHVLGLDNPDVIRDFESRTGAVFWTLYGQTETSGMVSFSPSREKAGSAGKPGMLIRMRLVDEEETPVPLGTSGEIVVQGPLVFLGFWNRKEDSRFTFRNGWHHTGDLGRLDEEGYLWFAGRKPEKELIKPGGENVYPAEVEQVVREHPDVDSVSVIGVPDPKFGEGVKAVCVLKAGKTISPEELMEFVAGRIARYKKPRYVQFVESLPKTASGAVDRARVKELYGKQ